METKSLEMFIVVFAAGILAGIVLALIEPSIL
jgi:xanthosine utilization system XapX-like protein